VLACCAGGLAVLAGLVHHVSGEHKQSCMCAEGKMEFFACSVRPAEQQCHNQHSASMRSGIFISPSHLQPYALDRGCRRSAPSLAAVMHC
jgi:hypothetical protein